MFHTQCFETLPCDPKETSRIFHIQCKFKTKWGTYRIYLVSVYKQSGNMIKLMIRCIDKISSGYEFSMVWHKLYSETYPSEELKEGVALGEEVGPEDGATVGREDGAT